MVEGEVMTIGRSQFVVGEMIGEGAYARVWSATDPAGLSEAAIKEMRCGQGPGILPDATVQRAIFEVGVMQRLGEDDGGPDVCAPRVVDHQFWQLGASMPGAFLCRVAMTRRPGTSLASWLEARVARGPRATAPSHVADEAMRYCMSFIEAAHFGRAMVAQIAPTLGKLNASIAYHRDVNARNLLVYSPSDADPDEPSCGSAPPDATVLEFSLVDFGSSTDARAWLGAGEGSWQVENPTGDARYWGPVSWLRFLGGAQAVAQDAGMCWQYSRRLDVFALAICSLESIAKLHSVDCPTEAMLRALPANRSVEARLIQGVQRLRGSWSSYWAGAVGYFDRLAEYSRQVCCGDQNGAAAIWQELSSGSVPQMQGQRLHELCMDLQLVEELCRAMRGGNISGTWSQAADALSVIRDMATEGSMFDWPDLIMRIGPPARRRWDAAEEPEGRGTSVVTSAGGVPLAGSSSEVMASDGSDGAAGPGTRGTSLVAQAARTPPVPQMIMQPQSLEGTPAAGPNVWTTVPDPAGGPHRMPYLSASVEHPPMRQQAGVAGRPSISAEVVGAGAELTPAMRQGMAGRPSITAEVIAGQAGTWPDRSTPGGLTPVTVAVAPIGAPGTTTAATAAGTQPQALGRQLSPHGEAPGLGRQPSPGQGHEPQGWRAEALPPRDAASPGIGGVASGVPETQSFNGLIPPLLPLPAQVPAAGLGLDSPANPPPMGSQLRGGLAEQTVGTPNVMRQQSTGDSCGRSAPPMQSVPGGGEEREHEALRILRQVELEVRTLKRWYTEAIEAMRSPAFPAWGHALAPVDASAGRAGGGASLAAGTSKGIGATGGALVEPLACASNPQDPAQPCLGATTGGTSPL